MATHTSMAQGSDAAKEHSWHGQIRTRFTDFQVHEISGGGEVVHLHDFQTNARELPKTEPSRQSTANPQATQLSPSKETAVETHRLQPADSEQPKDVENPPGISQSDQSILTDILGHATTEELIDLHIKANLDKKSQPKVSPIVTIAAISDKAQRSRVHSEIRRVFGGKIDTSTDGDGSIKAAVVGRGNQQWANRSRNPRNSRSSRNEKSRDNGQSTGQPQEGKFLHFTLYKENRDTMEAINQIARFLNVKPAAFGTAGTKDRRAVTTQRVSMRRRNPQSLVSLNNGKIYGVKIGDFKLEQHQIHLGQHKGNEFVIVVKNCHFSGTENLTFEQRLDIAKATIDSALQQVNQNGFINYYGTQRFGTHEIGTQEVGMKILKQDFEGAVQALLSFDPSLLDISGPNSDALNQREDVARAKACSIFLDTGDSQDALKFLPRRCHVESTLMRHLGRQPKDFIGALLSIYRGMRTMYVHAYQSLVWNFAASQRWEIFGPQVVKGDLVLVESEASTPQGVRQNTNDDEEMIHLEDGGADEMRGLKAHALTEDEIHSGKYSIFDIVLPTPGWDVVYPDNEIAQFYIDFMAREENGGLDPQNMLRRQKDFSLPGSYRKLMGKFIGTPSASVRTYSNDTQQLVPTDLDLIRSRKAKEAAEHAAARRNLEAAPSAWQGFVDNVRDSDLQATSQARVERRKAEESSGLLESQARDTWVQTSVDGSNKRVKVSMQTDVVKLEDESTTSQTRGDEMQVDEGAADKLITEGPQPTSQNDRDSGPLPTTTLTSQVREDTLPEEQPEGQTSNPQNRVEQEISDDVLRTPSNEGRGDGADDDGQTAGGLKQPVDTTTNENPAAQIPQSLLSETADGKIAVILRFALNTSQYATIALRELQGFVPASDHIAASVSLTEEP